MGNSRNIALQLELGDSGDDWEEYRWRNIEENQELLQKIGLGDPVLTPGKWKVQATWNVFVCISSLIQ
jgi:hypothetical protein